MPMSVPTEFIEARESKYQFSTNRQKMWLEYNKLHHEMIGNNQEDMVNVGLVIAVSKEDLIKLKVQMREIMVDMLTSVFI